MRYRSHERVVEGAAQRAHRVVLARRVHAIGQQHDVEILLGIDPERRAGEAGVADRARRQRVPHDEVGSIVSQPSARELPGTSTCAANARSVSRRAERRSSRRDLRSTAARTRRRRRPYRTAPRDRRRRRAPRRSRRAPRPAAARPRHEIELGRRAPLTPFAAAENSESRRSSSGAIDANCWSSGPPASSRMKPEQDESEIAVDRMRARRVFERQRADGVLELRAALMIAKRRVRRQARGMLEQIRERDSLAIRAAPRRAVVGDHASSSASGPARRPHRQRRRRDHLGQRREIEDRVERRRRRAGVVGERPNGLRQSVRGAADFDDGRGKARAASAESMRRATALMRAASGRSGTSPDIG